MKSYGISHHDRSTWRYKLAVWFLIGLMGWPIVGVGAAAAGTPPAPTPVSGGSIDLGGSIFGGGSPILSGQITTSGDLAIPVIPEISGVAPLEDGQTLFGNTINLYIYNLHTYNESIKVTVFEGVNGIGQNGTSVVSISVYLPSLQVTEHDINFPNDNAQTNANLTVDGVSWVFPHLTPVSLLANLIPSIGGLDLIIIIILVELVVLVCPLIILGRFLTRKAIHAPNFNLTIWGHVVVITILVLIFTDYQWFDTTFGGWSYFFYPVPIAIMIFLWSLHLFNRANVVEILKPDTMSGHRLRYLRWEQLTGEMKDGSTVIIDQRWRGFFYGLLGHFAKLIPVESEATVEGRPVAIDVENREALAGYEIRKMEKKLRRVRPGKERPEDDFKIVNSIDEGEPIKIFWVDSDQPVVVEFPHLSWRKNVEVPERVDSHGIRVAAHTEQVLTWPHIVDGESTIRLAGIHYIDAPLAALGWSRAEDDFELLEKRAYAVYNLRSRLHSEADRLTEERLSEMLTLMERGELPLTEEEAQAATERRPRDIDRLGDMLDRPMRDRELRSQRRDDRDRR